MSLFKPSTLQRSSLDYRREASRLQQARDVRDGGQTYAAKY